MDAADPLLIATGLPRSGTSLLMAMLQAAGWPLLVDDQRPPDPDNPRGYFEYAPVKRLAREAAWLRIEAPGRAVKIVLPLLRFVPRDCPARVVWMKRDLDEVLASQEAMLRRQGGRSAPADILRPAFERELTAATQLMAGTPAWHVHVVDHRELLTDPATVTAGLAVFLDIPAAAPLMAACVDPSLHRQRSRRPAHP